MRGKRLARCLSVVVFVALLFTTFRIADAPAIAQNSGQGDLAESFSGSFTSGMATRRQAADVPSGAGVPSGADDPLLPPPGLTRTFSNSSPINLPNNTPASLYPSVINVSNMPSQMAKITVTLTDMNHTFPQDLDLLLVGPQGQNAVIMSDVGGATDLVNVNLTLDDDSGIAMPLLDPISSGVYKPTNQLSGGADTWPAPAPAAPTGGSSLSTFSFTNPNGEWKLYVVDDVPVVDPGSIHGGWSITITSAFSGQSTDPIAITDSGAASPYPSEITITDHPDPVSFVRVNIFGFTHSSPDDVDILLASPSGRAVVLMSDVGGGSSVSNLNLTFDDTSPLTAPDTGPLFSGTYRPTNFELGDAFPAPAPAVTGRTLASFNGSVANGGWKLYIVDDAGNNAGSISGGWTILIGTTPDTISVPTIGAAAPYPSSINVTGAIGNTTRVIAQLRNFSHTFPDDVDILLVAPDGRSVTLMSDVGGGTEVGALDLTFDDLATAQLPDNSQIVSGPYRPTDFEPGDIFPLPAPAGAPTGTGMNAFYGGAPNGTWRLFVVNDGANGFGSIAGTWTLSVQSSTSACLVNIAPLVQGFPVSGGSGSFGIQQPAGCSWTASTSDSFISITSPASGGGDGSVAFNVAPNQGPPRTGTIDVTNGVSVRSFQVQQASGCPFSVAQSTVNFTAAGGNGNVSVTAGTGCSWQGSTNAGWIQITSQPQNGNGNLAFTVQPNASRAMRSATIDLGTQIITVNQAGVRTAPFDFDGDARSDVSVFRPSTGTWWIARSSSGTTASQFGIASDRPVAADYDGDLKTDIAVYRDGVWYVLKSSDGTAAIVTWGTATDKPVPADYNADGSAEIAVYRPSTGAWWILNSNGTFTSAAFGLSSDIPTPADYDGDGLADLSVYRPAASAGLQGTWWIFRSSDAAVLQTAFGVSGDVPVAMDFDGDGRDNIAVYRPSTGYWYRSANAAANYDAVQWGLPGDIPAAGDYDGDGRVDPTVVRPGSSLVWYVFGSASGPTGVVFGALGDKVIPTAAP